MNVIQAKLEAYLDSIARGEGSLANDIADEAGHSIQDALMRQFNPVERKFGLRMSNVGKPLCQLLAERDNMEREDNSFEHVFRMLTGDILEAIIVPVMKAAGINITREQGAYTLKVPLKSGKIHQINGTDDIEIDNESVWDIKSASDYSFKHKFVSYDALKAGDDFGYIPQLYGYSLATGLRAGGWIVINKNSGQIKVLEADQSNAKEEAEKAFNIIKQSVEAVYNVKPFERSFEAIVETFYGKETGKKYLSTSCEFCNYKRSCWPGLVHAPIEASKAKNPQWRYYVE